MPPPIACVIFLAGVIGLCALDNDPKERPSGALWIPIIWILIAGSRMVSQWLQTGPVSSADQYMEGSPLDRNILTCLMVAGIVVLCQRTQALAKVLRRSGPFLFFLAYCGASCLWSDYSDVAFKRWFKFLADTMMALIVLTDARPAAAIKRFFARAGFILIPASILLIKYYPAMGRAYDRWEGKQFYTGVTTDKNMLGMSCLVWGIAAVWRLIHEVRERKVRRAKGPLIAQACLVAMVLWLLSKANSMTSLSCFMFASCLMIASLTKIVSRSKSLVHLIVVTLIATAFAVLFLNMGSYLLTALGRDPTLTGRTDVWHTVLQMTGNPVLGTGFESFWLGDRLNKIWHIYWWHPNESHNGYLELFLNLGWAGAAILLTVILAGYRNIIAFFRSDPEGGRLRLAFFVAVLAYNFTEAAVKTFHPLWISFVIAILSVPPPAAARPKLKEKTDVAGAPLQERWRFEELSLYSASEQ